MAAAGGQHSLLLRSDGQVLVFGNNKHRQSEPPPPLPAGKRYVAVAAGYRDSVVLRDDNRAYTFGQGRGQWCEAPGVMSGMRYLEASAGAVRTALLTDCGNVVLSGKNPDGQCALDENSSSNKKDALATVLNKADGVEFKKVTAGAFHTVAVQDDGQAVAVGDNTYGQCEVPDAPTGIRYIDAAAGRFHTVLLREDGQALAFGDNSDGQLEVPELPLGAAYVDVACGDFHTIIMRDDGQAFAFGRNTFGQCDIPALPEGMRWGNLVVVVRASMGVGIKRHTGDLCVEVEDKDHAKVWELRMDPELDHITVGEMRKDIAKAVSVPVWSLRLFEQNGRLLASLDDNFTVLSVFNL